MFLWLCGARCPRYNPVSLCVGGDVYFGVLIPDIASFAADSWTPRNPGSSPLCKAICHVSCSHSQPKPSSLPGFKPNLSTSRFDRLHCNAGCRKRVTWEAYWIETGPTLLGSNAELWLQGQDEHGQVKNTYTQVPKYDVAFKPRKWKVNFMTILKRSTPLKLLMFVGFLCSLRKLGAPGSWTQTNAFWRRRSPTSVP